MARKLTSLRAVVGLASLGFAGLAVATVAFTDREAQAKPMVRRANPATLSSVLLAARGGEHVVLAPGDYGDVTFPRKVYKPGLTIDAAKARFTSLKLGLTGGVTIDGGIVVGPFERGFAVLVDTAHDITVSHMRVSGSSTGVGVQRSQRVAVTDNLFDGMRSDGVNVISSQQVRIERNMCRNIRPTPAVYDAVGRLVRDGNHPDCIQGWSVAGSPPSADVTIIGNVGRGPMQGVFFGNPAQGGVDRIVVERNTFDIGSFNGIVLMGARNAVVRANVVRTIPGARLPNYPFKPVTAWIKVHNSPGAVVCGNTVDAPRFSDDRGPCRDPR